MNSTLEDAIYAEGCSIFEDIKADKDSLFDKQYWLGKLMDWVMKDPEFKIDLFRFVDVLPMLSSGDQVSKHIKEYLQKGDREVPMLMNTALKAATFSFTQGIAAKAIRKNVSEMAQKFIAGSNVLEAQATIKRLDAEGFCFTVDLLGEKTLSDAEADSYQERYIRLIHDLPSIIKRPFNHDDPPNVSVKISALSSRLMEADPGFSIHDLKKRVLPILRAAHEVGVFINFDVENFQSHEICFELFKDLAESAEFKSWPHLGIVIQAYLTKSPKLAADMIELAKRRQAPLTIRLVKGAYWDYETIKAEQLGHTTPVFQQKSHTDLNYEFLSKLLIDHVPIIRPAFGSHNIRSLSHAIAYANSLGVDKKDYEIQMLYGMAEAERRAFANRGHRVRIYMPLGDMLPGMSYLVRRLLENTSQMGFLRLSHHEHHDMESLLTRPSGAESLLKPPTHAFQNAPLADFTHETYRQNFKEALEKTLSLLPISVPIVIDGKRISSTNTKKTQCPSKLSLQLTNTYLTDKSLAHDAVLACEKYHKQGSPSLNERYSHLIELANNLEKDRFNLAALICLEVGKTWAEADADVAEAIDFCRYYAQQALVELAPQTMKIAGEINTLSYFGRGPSVIIAPWNFPLAILCGMSVAAYVAGNPIIMKPAEQACATAYALFQHMEKAQFHPGSFHFLPGIGEEIGPTLVNHPHIANICFTGSMNVGHQIIQNANTHVAGQTHMKRVICEMGGKNAIIVDDDADLDEAVMGIINSACIYAGQKCSAASRVIAIGSIKDALVQRLKEAASSLTIGPSFEPSTFMGPVIDDEAFLRLKEAQQKLHHDPDIKIIHTQSAPQGGHFIPPLIVQTHNPHHWVMQQELFGPIVAIFHAMDIDEAIKVANNTDYALTGAFFSRSPSNIAYATERLQVGNLYINSKCTGAMVSRQPFGGFKMSGVGFKAGGPSYLLQLVDSKVVTENTMRRGFAPEISV